VSAPLGTCSPQKARKGNASYGARSSVKLLRWSYFQTQHSTARASAYTPVHGTCTIQHRSENRAQGSMPHAAVAQSRG
jgi:hypothetical protein